MSKSQPRIFVCRHIVCGRKQILSYSFYIDAARGIVFTTASGDLTMEEALAYAEALRDDPDFRPTMNALVDARTLTSVFSATEVRQLARVTPFRAESRRAIVVASDLQFGLGRMYVLTTGEDRPKARVFKDMQEARAWSGIEEADG